MWRSALIITNTSANTHMYFTTTLCELIHNASLILDDIEDDSLKRRGEPCIHKKYGLDVAVNSGSLLYFKLLSMIKENLNKGRAKYYSICMEEL